MAMTANEYWKRTGVTEGYAAEILKDAEHAAWHMPQGAKWADEAAEETVEPTVDDPTDETGAGEGTDTGDGADLDEGTQEPVNDEGGSVEGEPEE
jgi:hypothetical protein